MTEPPGSLPEGPKGAGTGTHTLSKLGKLQAQHRETPDARDHSQG